MITPEPMNPWMPITDIRLLALLSKTGEELNELGKAINRALMQGLDGRDPKTGEENREAVMLEIADVRGLCAAIIRELEFNEARIDARADQKEANVFAWMDMIAPWGQRRLLNASNIYQKTILSAFAANTSRSYARTGQCFQTDVLNDWRDKGVPLIKRVLDNPPMEYVTMTMADLVNHVDAPYARAWKKEDRDLGMVTATLVYGSDPAIAELPRGPIEAHGAPDNSDYDSWLAKGRELFTRHQGEPVGLLAWHGWSEGAHNYDPDALEAKWKEFGA